MFVQDKTTLLVVLYNFTAVLKMCLLWQVWFLCLVTLLNEASCVLLFYRCFTMT